MGKNWGMLKYMVNAPFARPVNFFKYGGGFYAILRAIDAGPPSGHFTVETFIPILVTYLQTKYLPPSSVWDVIIPIVLGAAAAGLKWRASQRY
ncbi:hypothetical protein [Salinigranum marinum]|uniref:hypothetical protein n=1 Tax=Salinigranum marinum TaxID=1515595 RepID=UPI002989AFFF|nr:hypothetical protein [Salinigranum marinum]